MGISRVSYLSILCPEQHKHTPHLKMMSKTLFALVFVAMVAGAFAGSCEDCEKDVIADVAACKGVVGQEAIVTCVMDVLKTSADCITCVCGIVADFFQLDNTICA